MPFIIDGHNLIGALPDIHLHDPDDEEQLLLRLQSYCAHRGKTITVYFDQAPGVQDTIRRGPLTAHFVSRNRTADDAIRAHLRRLKRRAANWTVVSSDREVLDFARRAGARTQTSQDFAAQLSTPAADSPDDDKQDIQLTTDELLAWETMFAKRSGPDEV